ncbi:beta-1,6-N-acetylglucosaminyltransferase [Sphingobacterium corticis]|uniref:Peptide O-xylosyltransferase n=1 Tax=Sphingobacterium corticis TaxID=1812823 RepID=A0ABW5NIP5_9SPHI
MDQEVYSVISEKMENRHAYLILSHDNFSVLQALISALDDARNDIYIHFDKKVAHLPTLQVANSQIIILENRIDVRWGHTNMLEAEFNLLQSAIRKNPHYTHYHIISGTHLPLQTKDNLHSFFEKSDISLFMKMETSEKEIDLKLRNFNLFIKNFASSNATKKRITQLLWLAMIKTQKWLHIKRHSKSSFVKTSQWCSLTQEAVETLIKNQAKIASKYRWTFCADEFFVASSIKDYLGAEKISYIDNMLKCEFEGTSPKIYTLKDWSELKQSNFLFARKFSENHLDIVEKITSNLIKTEHYKHG